MQSLLKIAVCENCNADSKTMMSYIEQSGYTVEAECFESGEKLMEKFEKERYHVVFMDIYMDGMSGIEAVRSIRESDSRVLIVFVTTSREHALESYRLGALKYIEKPVTLESIKDSLELAVALTSKRDVLRVSTGKDCVDIPLAEIYYIEVIDHVCLIHTESGVVKTYANLKEICYNLPPRFLKCHRAYVANMDHIREIDEDFIMDNGDVVYISRKNIHRIKKEYMKYLCNTARGRE